jgi:hypothetical protein
LGSTESSSNPEYLSHDLDMKLVSTESSSIPKYLSHDLGMKLVSTESSLCYNKESKHFD